jgi:hypothetical protein
MNLDGAVTVGLGIRLAPAVQAAVGLHFDKEPILADARIDEKGLYSRDLHREFPLGLWVMGMVMVCRTVYRKQHKWEISMFASSPRAVTTLSPRMNPATTTEKPPQRLLPQRLRPLPDVSCGFQPGFHCRSIAFYAPMQYPPFVTAA